MKQILLICVLVALVGCGTTSWVSDTSDPNNVKIEAAIRKAAKKPTGELTKADLEKVTRLDFHNDQLTDVTALEKCTQLKYLDLTDNKLTEAPKGLEKLTKLTFLELRGNQLTEVPKELEKLTKLTRLRLDYNKLTDVKGLEKLTQLERLWLDDNQLTSVKGLEKLTKLTDLFLHDNPDLTKTQIAELQKALPKCQILSNPTK